MWLFGFSIGSFYNELTLAILYRVVDTYDDHEPCSCRRKLHDESRLIQRSFDDNKDDDLKESKNEFKMFKRKFDFKNQDSRFKLPKIKIKIQDSRFKNQGKN